VNIEDLSESKSTKSEVHYQAKPHAGQRCINCTMWRDPNKCSAVAGNISSDGWCDYWAPGAYGKHGKSIDESEILDEGWRENLYKLVAIGALSLTSAAAIGTKLSYDKWAATHPQAVQALNTADVQKVEPTKIAKQTPPTANVDVVKSKLAPSDSIRPLARPPELTQEPTSQQRPKAKPSLDTLGPTAKPLHTAATNSNITGTELIALMAQAAHETKMFSDLVEKGNQEYFKKYDPEFSPKLAKILGNTEVGDGFTYRGRGYLHLTGRYNYEKAGTALGYPLIDNPDLAADPAIAAEIAIWFWKNRVQPRVTDFSNIKSVTHPINPRYVGLDDRKEKYKYILNLVKQFDLKLDEVVIDNVSGWGNVPMNQNVAYMGLRVQMTPRKFLELAYELTTSHSANDIENHIRNGGSIGAPFLQIVIPPEWFDGDLSKPAHIRGHEGRNRMTAVLNAEGNAPVETHLFFNSGVRNRHLTPEIIKRLNQDIISERRDLINGPWFTLLDNQRLSEYINTGKTTVQNFKFINNITNNERVSSEPKYTLREWAAMQGGHSIEELPPTPKLFDWLLNTGKDI